MTEITNHADVQVEFQTVGPPETKRPWNTQGASIFYTVARQLMQRPGEWATVQNVASSRPSDFKKWAAKRGMVVEAVLRDTLPSTKRGTMWARYLGPTP